jgi:hypothetical protein
MVAELVVTQARTDKPITGLRCTARVGDVEVLRGDAAVYLMRPRD